MIHPTIEMLDCVLRDLRAIRAPFAPLIRAIEKLDGPFREELAFLVTLDPRDHAKPPEDSPRE